MYKFIQIIITFLTFYNLIGVFILFIIGKQCNLSFSNMWIFDPGISLACILLWPLMVLIGIISYPYVKIKYKNLDKNERFYNGNTLNDCLNNISVTRVKKYPKKNYTEYKIIHEKHLKDE